MIFKNILEVPALILARFPYKVVLFSIEIYENSGKNNNNEYLIMKWVEVLKIL